MKGLLLHPVASCLPQGDVSVTKKLEPWINLERGLLNCFTVCTRGMFQYVMETSFPIANKECIFCSC